MEQSLRFYYFRKPPFQFSYFNGILCTIVWACTAAGTAGSALVCTSASAPAHIAAPAPGDKIELVAGDNMKLLTLTWLHLLLGTSLHCWWCTVRHCCWGTLLQPPPAPYHSGGHYDQTPHRDWTLHLCSPMTQRTPRTRSWRIPLSRTGDQPPTSAIS